MIINTPPLSVSTVKVFPALFKAQLPDTLAAIRRAIPEWAAVHVVADGAGKRGPSAPEMTDELAANLKPLSTLYSPIYRLTTPEIPPATIATFVPDRFKPAFAPEYEGWKYVLYADARELLQGLFDQAVGGIPEGHVGLADALVKGEINGQAVLEGWTGSVGMPSFMRTMEAIVKPENPVMFWDTSFGFEASGESFLKSAHLVLQMLGANFDRLYFDAAEFSWFVAFYPGGQMRVGMLG